MKKLLLMLPIIVAVCTVNGVKMSCPKAALYGKLYAKVMHADQPIGYGAYKKFAGRNYEVIDVANKLMNICSKPSRKNYAVCKEFIKNLKAQSVLLKEEFTLEVAQTLEKKLIKFTGDKDILNK